MAMDVVDYEIKGAEMQYVEVELDPGEAAIGEAGSLMLMDAVFGDGSAQQGGLFGKLLGAGKRLVTGESLFTTIYSNPTREKRRVAFAAPYPGKIVAMDLRRLGGTLICQKDAFLCAARGVSLGIALQRRLFRWRAFHHAEARGRPACSARFWVAMTRSVLVAALLLVSAALHAAPPTEIESMTSPEVRARIAAGSTTLLVPIGGTEQNGAHMVLGKHNVRARVLARQIADKLGNALVAPVMAYVPEGGIDPPQAHMRFAGTLSIPEPVFEAVLDATVRSACRHGFRDVIFLGDHGGYQRSLQRAADKFSKNGGGSCRAIALTEYYAAAVQPFNAALAARGFSKTEIGTHAGLADTSLALAVDPALVRADALTRPPSEGVAGDPRRGSAELGRAGIAHIVDASVAAVRERTRRR